MYEIKGIAEIIQAANLATRGTDMFLYHSPPEAKNCIILFPSNDPPIIDPDLPGYLTGKFQIIIRNYDYETGIAFAKQLSNALTLFNTDTSLMFIKVVRPLYQVRVYRRSDSGEIEFSLTFQAKYIAK